MDNRQSERRNVFLLAGAQALFQTASVLVITLSGLVGQWLATDKSLATLSVGLMMVAAAASIIPAALFMRSKGARPGFVSFAARPRRVFSKRLFFR